jgi:hypothetical protein
MAFGGVVAASSAGKCAESSVRAHAIRWEDDEERRAVRGSEEPFLGLRHTSTEHAVRHAAKTALVWQLGRIKQLSLFLVGEEELRGSHPFNEMHELMAARALPQRRLCEDWCFDGRSLVEQSAAEWQHAGSPAVGEEAEVADTWKAAWQHVLYEAAQELFGGECKVALPAVVGLVLPAEADLSSRDREQAMVGNGDAMGVAS